MEPEIVRMLVARDERIARLEKENRRLRDTLSEILLSFDEPGVTNPMWIKNLITQTLKK